MFAPSKLYMFKEIKENVTLEQRTQSDPVRSESNNSDPQECVIWMDKPTERLLSLCQTISAYQWVTGFHFQGSWEVRCKLTEANVPVMSKEAKSLVLKEVNVSSSVWNHFLQHESLKVYVCLIPLYIIQLYHSYSTTGT